MATKHEIYKWTLYYDGEGMSNGKTAIAYDIPNCLAAVANSIASTIPFFSTDFEHTTGSFQDPIKTIAEKYLPGIGESTTDNKAAVGTDARCAYVVPKRIINGMDMGLINGVTLNSGTYEKDGEEYEYQTNSVTLKVLTGSEATHTYDTNQAVCLVDLCFDVEYEDTQIERFFYVGNSSAEATSSTCTYRTTINSADTTQHNVYYITNLSSSDIQSLTFATGGASGMFDSVVFDHATNRIIFTCSSNSGSQRTGYIYVKNGSTTIATITVNQAAAATYTLTAYTGTSGTGTAATVSYGSTSVTIRVLANQAWTATSNQTGWATLDTSTGNGDGTITVTIGSNASSTSSRTATITIIGAHNQNCTILITQNGNTPPPPSPTYTLVVEWEDGDYQAYPGEHLTAKAYIYRNGEKHEEVTNSTACTWSSDDTSIATVNNSSNKGDVTAVSAGNTDINASYNGFYGVYNESLYVEVIAVPTYDISVSPTTLNVSSAQTSQSVTVTTIGQGWVLVSNPDWVTSMSTTETYGAGSTSVSFYVRENSGQSRSDSIVFRGKTNNQTATVSITQSGQDSGDIVYYRMLVTPTADTISNGEATYFIAQLQKSAYTANWEDMSVSPSLGIDDGYEWEYSSSLEDAISIQCGAEAYCQRLNVTAITNPSSDINGWLKVSVYKDGSLIAYKYADLTVEHTGGTPYFYWNANGQSAYTATSIDYDETTFSESFSTNYPSLSVYENVAWITDSVASTANQNLSLTLTTNGGSQRHTTLYIYSGSTRYGSTVGTIVITQDAEPAETHDLQLSVDSHDAGMSNGSTTIKVSATGQSWTATSSDSSWLSCSPSTGSAGDTTVTISWSANTGGDRTGTITFTGSEGDEVTFTVAQDGVDPVYIKVNDRTDNISTGVSRNSGSNTVTVEGINENWSASTDSSSWLNVNRTTGTSGTEYTVTISWSANNGLARTGTITFTGQYGDTIEYVVEQDAAVLSHTLIVSSVDSTLQRDETTQCTATYLVRNQSNEVVYSDDVTTDSEWTITAGTSYGSINRYDGEFTARTVTSGSQTVTVKATYYSPFSESNITGSTQITVIPKHDPVVTHGLRVTPEKYTITRTGSTTCTVEYLTLLDGVVDESQTVIAPNEDCTWPGSTTYADMNNGTITGHNNTYDNKDFLIIVVYSGESGECTVTVEGLPSKTVTVNLSRGLFENDSNHGSGEVTINSMDCTITCTVTDASGRTVEEEKQVVYATFDGSLAAASNVNYPTGTSWTIEDGSMSFSKRIGNSGNSTITVSVEFDRIDTDGGGGSGISGTATANAYSWSSNVSVNLPTITWQNP